MVAMRKEDERTIEYARESLRGELAEELGWVEALSTAHVMQFAAELQEALAHAGITGDYSGILALLDSWEATAGVDADPETQEILNKPIDGRTISCGMLKGAVVIRSN